MVTWLLETVPDTFERLSAWFPWNAKAILSRYGEPRRPQNLEPRDADARRASPLRSPRGTP